MTMTLDTEVLAAHAEAARAAAIAHRDEAANLPDPRIREIEGGTVTLCPGGVLVFTPDSAATAQPASMLDAVFGPACTGTKKDGTACRGIAGTDGRCAAHKDQG